EEQSDEHHIEGEFHANGKRRLYQLTAMRSAVAIDPSSFRDRSKIRGTYVPPLDRSASAEATTQTVSMRAEAVNATSSHEPVAVHVAEQAETSTRSKVGWIITALALTLGVWHFLRARSR